MKKSLLLLFALFFSVGAIVAQSPEKQKLDSFFDVLALKNLAMGSIAISKNGKVIYRRSVGLAKTGGEIARSDHGSRGANRGAGDGGVMVEADAHTEYRIRSISKLFTATLVFQLLEENRMHLD